MSRLSNLADRAVCDPVRVLFVDDEAAVLDGLRRSLRSIAAAWKCSFHGGAAEALEALRDEETAVVVSDWRMPERDGIDLCHALREREASQRDSCFYVLILTGLQQREAVVRALDEGADDFLTKPFDTRELCARIRVGARLLRAEAEVLRANRELERLASTDALTGLANRRKAREKLESELARVERSLQWLTVFMLDIDHFKQFNDAHGHAAGDAVLLTVARRFRRCCRPYDMVARWGGEEMLVICPSADLRCAGTIGERLRRALADSPFVLAGGVEVRVSVSVGGALAAPGESVEARDLVARADAALYAAKEAGRDCVRIGDSQRNLA